MASHIGEAGMSRHVPGSPRQQAEHIVRQEAARFADVGWTVLPAVRTVLPLIKFFRTDILQQLSPKWLQKRKGGYKGRSGIERFLFGSVSNRVMYHARCSVWVVRG
ncbi:MAG: universal stress protein [Candidatus Eisenbacteria sp.]|nr:universal stress protein [Candidatus Eisenbacteria bacterium]